MSAPKAPAGLGRAGRALWRRLTGRYEFTVGELLIVEQAARQADLVADLEAALERDGLVVLGSQGQPRLNAVATELRQSRLALGRLLGDLRLPTEDDRPMSAASLRARHAALARWAPTAQLREARRGDAAS